MDFRPGTICRNTTTALAGQQPSAEVNLSWNNTPDTFSPRRFVTSLGRVQWTGQAAARAYQNLWHWGLLVRTPLYSVSVFVHARKVTRTRSSESKVSVLRHGYCILYPSRLLSLVGLSCGVLLEGICTTEWKWTPRMFNAVPEDAPIFDLCRKGDLAGIKTLREQGNDLVRYMDPKGRTPLLVSASLSSHSPLSCCLNLPHGYLQVTHIALV